MDGVYIAAADPGVCYADEDVVGVVVEGGNWTVFKACVEWAVEKAGWVGWVGWVGVHGRLTCVCLKPGRMWYPVRLESVNLLINSILGSL